MQVIIEPSGLSEEEKEKILFELFDLLLSGEDGHE